MSAFSLTQYSFSQKLVERDLSRNMFISTSHFDRFSTPLPEHDLIISLTPPFMVGDVEAPLYSWALALKRKVFSILFDGSAIKKLKNFSI